MKTFTDTTYQLTENDMPLVTPYDHAVSLHLPGYMGEGDGRGFSLRFLPAQLPILRDLVLALEALQEVQETPEPPVDETAVPVPGDPDYDDALRF